MPATRRPRALPTATIGGGVTLTPAAVSVTPSTAEVEEAATVQLAATVTDERGNTLTVQKAAGASVLSAVAVVWSSDDTNTATVNSSTGLVTGVAEGECTITATVGSLTDTCAVTVTAAA